MSRPRDPVLIGAAQCSHRFPDLATAASPVDLLEEVARGAAEDSELRGVLDRVDTLALVNVVAWYPTNPNRLLADRLGIQPARELLAAIGGDMAIALVNHVAEAIQTGDVQVALVAGVNNLDTLARARKAGVELGWPTDGAGRPEELGVSSAGTHERETAHGAIMPTEIYPILETALRAQRGLDPAEHARRIGALMSPFTRVAASNPHAWFPTERSAEELVTPTPENRMIAAPYTKYLNAVLNTDQASAILLCAAEVADELGVPEARRVHWWGGAHTKERAWFVSERPDFWRSVAQEVCAERVQVNAGVSTSDIAHFDFYSCFPVAVETACEAYGVAEDDPRGHTVTGGLPYAGGPANNYTLHAIAAMAERLRANPGDRGLVTGNGWYLTKHSASIWSTEPKPGRPPTSNPTEESIVGPEPLEAVDEAEGGAVIDGYTVTYDRDGSPSKGIVIATQDDGRRFVANTPDDHKLLETLTEQEGVGLRGVARHRDGRNEFDPS